MIEALRAAGEPTRLRVLALLRQRDLSVGELVQVLEQFFGMGREKATQVMLAVHTQGKGVCGIYPQDIAETKASQVNQCARDSGHPLLCEVEPSSDDEED